MKNLSILIYGSCVSRDSLEFISNREYSLINYFARSSLATLNYTNPVASNSFITSLNNIESKFQKRIVEYDLQHSILKSIVSSEYDVLLMDLIDERFHLALLDNNQLVTRSNEFLKTKIKPKSLINTHSDKFFDLWKQGVDNFFSILDEKGTINTIKLQRTFWTNELDSGSKIENISDEQVLQENEKLEQMYLYLERYLKKDQFIEIPLDLIIAKSDHKWGVSPFHFIDDYYHYVIKSIT
ncbi:DUF6270 domain-containing protein [Acinetobacter larvae]|uniref:Uncharacterized protein n=1 Tax=Acinetobacter larvae TaxID=1789224 RepID=A0A1B2M1Y6_9GAMM|nr:DUF6270 domain-containing protein [Acinetobacter larvae]AOA59205.1 hypothetical protein BFG52_13130 [Acinetobacter larvae]